MLSSDQLKFPHAAIQHQAAMQSRDLCFGRRNIGQRELAGKWEARDFKMHR